VSLEPAETALLLVEHCGHDSAFGRTSLQKVAYLAGAMLGWEMLGHSAYHYGPYSRALDRETNRLVQLGLLDEEPESLGFVSATGFHGWKYHYRLTDAGRSRVAQLDALVPADVGALRQAADRIREAAGGFNQRTLSLAAKTHFVVSHDRGCGVTDDEIVNSARELGWRVTTSDVRTVASQLEKLGLVEIAE
jgi:uncharacterized protein YwgA